MARIGKQEHARILQLVDGEKRKVAEVAAEYGCTPSNIHALLGKLRRAARPQGEQTSSKAQTGEEPARLQMGASEIVPAVDLFAVAVEPAEPAVAPTQSPLPAPSATAVITEMPRKTPISKRGGIGAARARPGFGLTMRTADGDETMTPFRSLEELLSAVKPILRSASRSPDAVWFSIGSIDLSQLDHNAA